MLGVVVLGGVVDVVVDERDDLEPAPEVVGVVELGAVLETPVSSVVADAPATGVTSVGGLDHANPAMRPAVATTADVPMARRVRQATWRRFVVELRGGRGSGRGGGVRAASMEPGCSGHL